MNLKRGSEKAGLGKERIIMNRDPGCIFCRIASKEVEAKIVYEDEKIMAVEDVNPQAPAHLLVIPKSHIPTLQDIGDEESGLMDKLFRVINRMAKDRGFSEKGYRVVVNCGPAGGQTVYHLHLHLLGGRNMKWPPG